jgi:transcriptional regulator with XRE-family HTH domain
MALGYQAELRRRIRAAMASKGWEAKHLAAAMQQPHPQTVNLWLSDDPAKGRHRSISIANIERIAKALGVTYQSLDPNGTEGYDPLNRPPHMRRGAGAHSRNTDKDRPLPHTDTDTDPLHSGNPLTQSGAFPMAELPDLALFQKLEGLWRALEPADRQDVYSFTARLIGESATRAKAKNE